MSDHTHNLLSEQTLSQYRSHLDDNSPFPLYYQVALVLQSYIEEAGLSPGAAFFSEEEISLQLNISRPTANRAIKELLSKGYLSRSRGQRAVVESIHSLPLVHMGQLLNVTEMLSRMGQEGEVQLLERDLIQPPEYTASALNLTSNAKAIHMKRLRVVNTSPVLVVDSYLPSPRFDRLLEIDEGAFQADLYTIMEQEVGAVAARAERDVWASHASRDDATLLSIPVWEPCLRIRSVTYSSENKPLLTCDTRLNAMRCTLRSSLNRSV
jgi:GntR family transcriptional regulator